MCVVIVFGDCKDSTGVAVAYCLAVAPVERQASGLGGEFHSPYSSSKEKSGCALKERISHKELLFLLNKQASLGTLCAARRVAAFVHGDDVIHKLFTEMAYRYKDRAGGYTRLLRTRIRTGDAAEMAYIEFIDRDNELRQSKPPNPQPPQRPPMDPWTRSRLTRQMAPPKEDSSLPSDL